MFSKYCNILYSGPKMYLDKIDLFAELCSVNFHTLSFQLFKPTSCPK